jgi:hypothetical protein
MRRGGNSLRDRLLQHLRQNRSKGRGKQRDEREHEEIVRVHELSLVNDGTIAVQQQTAPTIRTKQDRDALSVESTLGEDGGARRLHECNTPQEPT